jgi:hypothetical protein
MEPKKSKFEVGEKCIIYSHGMRLLGEIINIDGMKYTTRVVDGLVGTIYCHEKQLRKLVKKKRRGWWMLTRYEMSTHINGMRYSGPITSDKKPEDTTG